MSAMATTHELLDVRDLTELEKQALLAQIPLVRRGAFCAGAVYLLIGLAFSVRILLSYIERQDPSILWLWGATFTVPALVSGAFFSAAFWIPPFLRGEAPWPKAGRYRGRLQSSGKALHYGFGPSQVNLQRGWSEIPLDEELDAEMTLPGGEGKRKERRQMLSIRTDDGRTWSLHDDAAAGKIPLHRTGWFSDPKRRWY